MLPRPYPSCTFNQISLSGIFKQALDVWEMALYVIMLLYCIVMDVSSKKMPAP